MGYFKEQDTNRQEDDRLNKPVDLGKTWTKESIYKLLETNDKAVGRALLVLLANQTDDEKLHQCTKYDNGKGFSPFDARRMTSLALFFKAKNYLSDRQLAWLRAGKSKRYHSRIGKYHAQLLSAINKPAV